MIPFLEIPIEDSENIRIKDYENRITEIANSFEPKKIILKIDEEGIKIKQKVAQLLDVYL